jgi:hypothetical protein
VACPAKSVCGIAAGTANLCSKRPVFDLGRRTGTHSCSRPTSNGVSVCSAHEGLRSSAKMLTGLPGGMRPRVRARKQNARDRVFPQARSTSQTPSVPPFVAACAPTSETDVANQRPSGAVGLLRCWAQKLDWSQRMSAPRRVHVVAVAQVVRRRHRTASYESQSL